LRTGRKELRQSPYDILQNVYEQIKSNLFVKFSRAGGIDKQHFGEAAHRSEDTSDESRATSHDLSCEFLFSAVHLGF